MIQNLEGALDIEFHHLTNPDLVDLKLKGQQKSNAQSSNRTKVKNIHKLNR